MGEQKGDKEKEKGLRLGEIEQRKSKILKRKKTKRYNKKSGSKRERKH